MTALRHLNEAERQGAADGTLASEVASDVTEHLGTCDVCAADVARLRSLMTRIHDAPPPTALDGDDLWPAIRARIEAEKVAPLRDAPRSASIVTRRRAWLTAGLAAAGVVLIALVVRRGPTRSATPDAVAPGTSLTAVAESTRVYEEQARFLLNQLELRRALMRPQTAASVDHDLEVIDTAIAELERAIERDPNNIALRALLASSYRQKVDLLKRIGNAG